MVQTDNKLHDKLSELGIIYQLDADIGRLTWYGTGGTGTLAHPKSTEQLSNLVSYCHQNSLPIYILGAGANLLVRNTRVPGIVITLDQPEFKQIQMIRKDDTKILLNSGAGVDLFKLVQTAARQGLSGLEAIAGIPGTVGGAARMNAGGAFGEIGESIHSVKTLTKEGKVQTLNKDNLEFSYRHTNIKNPVILEVTFALIKGEPSQIKKRVKEIFAYKKNSQPMGAASAGCTFKNPQETTGKAAGQLIDEAGLKGFFVGSATVSTVHANFITIAQNGRADDAVNLIEYVKQTVREKFNINLQREVMIWPDDVI